MIYFPRKNTVISSEMGKLNGKKSAKEKDFLAIFRLFRNILSKKTPGYNQDIIRPTILLKCVFRKNYLSICVLIAHRLIFPNFQKFRIFFEKILNFGRKKAF